MESAPPKSKRRPLGRPHRTKRRDALQGLRSLAAAESAKDTNIQFAASFRGNKLLNPVARRAEGPGALQVIADPLTTPSAADLEEDALPGVRSRNYVSNPRPTDGAGAAKSFLHLHKRQSREGRIPSIACESENIWFGEPPMSNLRQYATELGKTLALASPIMAGQVGQMLMGLIDTLMVGHIGTIPLAGAAFGLSLVSVAFVFGIGFLSSIGVLVAQAHGARMEHATRMILPSSIWLSVAIGTVLAVLLALLRPWFFLFHQPPEILDQALPFLVIVGWSLVPALTYISAKIFCESLSKPLVPMLMMYLGVSLNVFLNWVFIFGNLGAPALGLVGAGWATLISRTVTMFGTLLYCLHVTKSNLFDLSLARVRLRTIGALIRIGLPVSFQFLSEVAAFAFAAILIGLIGTQALAAHQIAITCAATTFMFPLGVSQAVTVRIGQAVGARSHSMVRIIAFSGVALSALVMLLFAFVYSGLGPSIARAFNSDREVVALASSLLVIAGIFQIADGVQVTAMGALRGLADVRVPMLLAFVFYWLFAIPIGYVGGFIYKAGAVGIWSGLAVGLFIAAATLTMRVWWLTRPGKSYETLMHSEQGAVL